MAWPFDYRYTENTQPVHDPPAVWRSWGVWSGGFPVVETDPHVPFAPRYSGRGSDDLPMLDAIRNEDAQ